MPQQQQQQQQQQHGGAASVQVCRGEVAPSSAVLRQVPSWEAVERCHRGAFRGSCCSVVEVASLPCCARVVCACLPPPSNERSGSSARRMDNSSAHEKSSSSCSPCPSICRVQHSADWACSRRLRSPPVSRHSRGQGNICPVCCSGGHDQQVKGRARVWCVGFVFCPLLRVSRSCLCVGNLNLAMIVSFLPVQVLRHLVLCQSGEQPAFWKNSCQCLVATASA
mmetsp:Transcript_12897/g.24911  ORF Transcript_12897/g.24911 Transcript_12897/m.24911 type:complete len:223 (+) Transcript_12897:1100-1768(+)